MLGSPCLCPLPPIQDGGPSEGDLDLRTGSGYVMFICSALAVLSWRACSLLDLRGSPVLSLPRLASSDQPVLVNFNLLGDRKVTARHNLNSQFLAYGT